MTTAWLDCSAGVAGDMFLGALLDAGAGLDAVNAAVGAVDARLAVRVEPAARHGIAGVRAVVQVDGHDHPESRSGDDQADQQHQQRQDEHPPRLTHDHDHSHHVGHPHDGSHRDHRGHHEPGDHRPYADVRALIEGADLRPEVRDRALRTFAALARAEAAVHGTDVDAVMFHEVGALDAIADVVGTCAAFTDLAITRLVCSPIALGGGRHVRGQHGGIPIPGPAVVALLTESGAPSLGGPAELELATPTGVALVGALADGYGPMPAMTIEAHGHGSGTKDFGQAPNLVRVVLGADSPAGGAAPGSDLPTTAGVVLATNVDDLDPRVWPDVLATLIAAGAADAWLTPILMKKGRPAHTLSVLCAPGLADRLTRVVFEQTSTIGLRRIPVDKLALDRELTTVTIDGHPVRVKVARLDGRVSNAQPEYADVQAAAAALGRPVGELLIEAAALARRLD